MAAPNPIPDDLGTIIQSIARDQLAPVQNDPMTIQNAERIASFNWIGTEHERTIVIPGAPPRWAPPKIASPLKLDNGKYYRDINAAYSSQSPLHATALAILADQNNITSSIDLLACASSLRSLLLFVRGEEKTFRIMVKAIGNTVFFIRREKSPDETIPNIRGYGHSMPEAYTVWDTGVQGSVSHQRVIKFTFAGMNMLLRYECDGYLPDKLPAGDASATLPSVNASVNTTAQLQTAMGNVSVSHGLPKHITTDLKVKQAGTHIPQCATFELKTRTSKRKDEDFFPEFAIRMWLTQTPWLVLAFHTFGKFKDIRVRNVTSEVSAWEQKNQDDIKKLASLVKLIMKEVKENDGGTLELWRHGKGNLELRAPAGEFYGSLPQEVENQWVNGEKGNGDI